MNLLDVSTCFNAALSNYDSILVALDELATYKSGKQDSQTEANVLSKQFMYTKLYWAIVCCKRSFFPSKTYIEPYILKGEFQVHDTLLVSPKIQKIIIS